MQSKGDASATVQVILGYYKHLACNTSNIRPPTEPPAAFEPLMKTRLEAKLTDTNIQSFDSLVNNAYESAFLLKFTNFSEP